MLPFFPSGLPSAAHFLAPLVPHDGAQSAKVPSAPCPNGKSASPALTQLQNAVTAVVGLFSIFFSTTCSPEHRGKPDEGSSLPDTHTACCLRSFRKLWIS